MKQDEPDPLSRWPAFATRVRERLEAGRAAYGDRSFSADPARLVEEIRQELLDVCGWAFVLATRLDSMERELAKQRPAGCACHDVDDEPTAAAQPPEPPWSPR